MTYRTLVLEIGILGWISYRHTGTFIDSRLIDRQSNDYLNIIIFNNDSKLQ